MRVLPNPEMSAIISSRTMIPKQTSKYVLRYRLMNMMSESQRVKLTIISASAGFGKSTIAAEWARQHTESTVWLSLDAKDNDLLRFWASVALSIKTKVPFKLPIEMLLQSIREGSIDMGVSLLLDELRRISEPLTLVLDDYHLITDQKIHESLFFFITYLPAQHHLILLSRTLPPLPLARLRAQQEMLELTGDDLRFTTDEIGQLQLQSLRIPLSTAELSLLEQKTEGWIAGIILALHSLSDRMDRTAYMESLGGNHRHIFDYLFDEVLSRQSEKMQDFLLQTSILHSFNASLAEAVLGESEVSQQIMDIEQAQLFLIPLDETRTWYRYHHLFSEMLLTRLHKKYSVEARLKLHRRATRWYEQHNMIIESLHHSMEAEDYYESADRMDKYFNHIIDLGEDSTLLGWLDSMPMQFHIGHSDLFYFQAGSMAVSGQLEHAKRFLDKAEKYMNEEHTPTAEAAREFQMKMNLYRASVSYYQGDIDAFIHILDENMDALERFSTIVKVINTTEVLLYRGPIGFGGRLKKMAYLSQQVSTSEQRRAMVHYTLQGHGFIFLSDLYYEWNHLDEANAQVDRVLASHDVSRHISVWVTGIVLKYKILKATGKEMEAEKILLSGMHEVSGFHSPKWERLLEAVYIRQQLVSGVIEAGEQWQAKRHLSSTDQAHVTREYEQITLARILIAKQDFDEAMSWLNRLLSEAIRADRIGSQLEILLLLAAVNASLEDKEQSIWDCLERALGIAADEGYLRIFLDEGHPLARLLLRWIVQVPESKQGAEYAYANHLISLFRSEQGFDEELNVNPDVHFTKRELELLGYIAKGWSNDEIASELFLSLGTVKRYLHHIYQKLDVKNRVQAVSKMKELHLI